MEKEETKKATGDESLHIKTETFKPIDFPHESISNKKNSSNREDQNRNDEQNDLKPIDTQQHNMDSQVRRKIIETGHSNLENAIDCFEKKVVDEQFPTFGVTEPNVVQTNQLVISPTQPTMEKELDELIITPTDSPRPKDELLSSRTLQFTVNSLLDSIMNENKPPPQPISTNSSQEEIPVIFNKPKEEERNSRLQSRQNSFTKPQLDLSPTKQEARKEELLIRKMKQEEASSRLAQPKKRPIRIVEEDKTPRKTRSRAEQRDAADRLSQPKTVIRDFYPPEPDIRPKKKVQVKRQTPITRSPENQRLPFSRKETQTEEKRESQPPPKATKEFKELMRGPKPKKPSAAAREMLTARTREIESTKSPEEIKEIVDRIIKKKKNEKLPAIDDPATIADIVNELTNRRVNALKDNDYIQSLKLQQLAEEVRTQFRIRDREHFHEDYMRELNNKLVITKNSMKQSEEEWTAKMKEFDENCKAELDDLDNRQDEEVRDLEDRWQRPEAQRKFSKKSPQLLSQQAREKNMALIGDLVGAHEMSKIVKRTEKIEASQKYENMMMTFEKERANLMLQQDQARDMLIAQQNQKRNNMQKQRDEINAQYKRRIQALERVIQDDADIEKFCAKKFKRSADTVIPMSATTVGGDDIPTTGKMRAAPLNLAGLMSYRENSVPTPLQLPTLRIKRAKSAKRHAQNETKKPREEF